MALQAWLVRAKSVGHSEPIALTLLLASNAVPLLGVLLLGWDVATILIAYWLENGVVGLLNMPKIALAARSADGRSASARRVGVVGRVVSFVFEYGMFWFVHGVFVFALMGINPAALIGSVPPPQVGRGSPDLAGILVIALALLASHATSFAANYLGQREYQRTTPEKQALEPFGRLVVLHLTILIGAFVVLDVGQPVALVALLVVLKTALDLLLHLREHRRYQAIPVAV